jgi:hypothetical protein
VSGSPALQLAEPAAFGNRKSGGPFAGVNYTWVMSSTRLFQFVANYMNKAADTEPGGDPGVTRVIQTNPAGNIAGSLTTISQDGSYGLVNTSRRAILYVYPSLTVTAMKGGLHEFKTGFQAYPIFRDRSTDQRWPVEYYFRPPGTTGSADILFEQQTFRNLDGAGSDLLNERYQHTWAIFFQDRWRPMSNLTVKGGVRIESNKMYATDRNKVLTALLPPELPTIKEDRQFQQLPIAPNFGIAYDAGKWGVFRGSAGKYFEHMNISEGTTATYVLATDIMRASPRTVAPTLNQALPGPFPIGVDYGDGNKRTYANEITVAWEKRLPHASSISATFLMKNTRDHQDSDDVNMARDPATGVFLGRVFPAYDAIRRRYAPNRIWTDFTALQLLYVRHFTDRWGMNANYWYQINNRIYHDFAPTTENWQYMTNPRTNRPFEPSDFSNKWASCRVTTREWRPLSACRSISWSRQCTTTPRA